MTHFYQKFEYSFEENIVNNVEFLPRELCETNISTIFAFLRIDMIQQRHANS